MFATLDFCKNLTMHHAEKNKNAIYRLGRSVLKNILSRSQKRPSAFGLGPFLRPRQNIFPVRTSQPVNNIYILIFSRVYGSMVVLETVISGSSSISQITFCFSVRQLCDLVLTDLLARQIRNI